MVAHACCHISRNQRPRLNCTDNRTVPIPFVETLSLLSLSLSSSAPMSSLVGTPLYMAKTLPLRSLSLSLHCVFQTQKSSLGSQSESDRPQKRAFTSLHTLTCLWFLGRSYFWYFFFFFFFVLFSFFHGDLGERVTFEAVVMFQLGSTCGFCVCLMFSFSGCFFLLCFLVGFWGL